MRFFFGISLSLFPLMPGAIITRRITRSRKIAGEHFSQEGSGDGDSETNESETSLLEAGEAERHLAAFEQARSSNVTDGPNGETAALKRENAALEKVNAAQGKEIAALEKEVAAEGRVLKAEESKNCWDTVLEAKLEIQVGLENSNISAGAEPEMVTCFAVPEGVSWTFTVKKANDIKHQFAASFLGPFAWLAEQNKFVVTLVSRKVGGGWEEVRSKKDNGPLMLLASSGDFESTAAGYETQYISSVHQTKLISLRRKSHNWNPARWLLGRYSFLIMPCGPDGEALKEKEKALYTIEKDKWGGRLINLVATSVAQTWHVYRGFTNTSAGFEKNDEQKRNQRYKACNFFSKTHVYRCYQTCDQVQCRERVESMNTPCTKAQNNNCLAAFLKQKTNHSFVLQGANDKFNVEVYEGQDALLMTTLAMAISKRNDAAQRSHGEGVSGLGIVGALAGGR